MIVPRSFGVLLTVVALTTPCDESLLPRNTPTILPCFLRALARPVCENALLREGL